MNKYTVIDYVVRILMAAVAFGIVFMLITSALSGLLAIAALAMVVLLIFFSITGFRKLKHMF